MYLEIVVDGLFKFRLKDEPRHSGALDIEEQKKGNTLADRCIYQPSWIVYLWPSMLNNWNGSHTDLKYGFHEKH